MADVLALAVLGVFYFVVLIWGIAASRWYKSKNLENVTSDEADLLAGRRLGSVVGALTMAVTYIDGTTLNGFAEGVAVYGVMWTLLPISVIFAGISGAILTVPRMHGKGYMTMLDPIQKVYDNSVVVVIYILTLVSDVFWSAAILAALGSTLNVMVEMNRVIAIISSAAVALLYTLFGQMVSVAYTDVLQFVCVVGGLGVSVPFVISNTHSVNDSSSPISTYDNTTLYDCNIPSWDTHWHKERVTLFIDINLTMILSFVPHPAYIQRILSVSSKSRARIMSVAGCLLCFLISVPSILIGIVAGIADWSQTELGRSPIELEMSAMVLPLVLRNFTPRPVTIIVLSALGAAAMSSLDSAILSSSTMFSQNIYKQMRRKSSSRELYVVRICAMVMIAVSACLLAIFSTESVYALIFICMEMTYIIVFPQFISVLYCTHVNVYGAHAGWVVGLVLRLLAGEPMLHLDPVIKYPMHDPVLGQLFPYRTFSMIASFLVICGVSAISNILKRGDRTLLNVEDIDRGGIELDKKYMSDIISRTL